MSAFTPETERIITDRYRAGEPRAKLAKEFYCSECTIRNIALRNGYQKWPNGKHGPQVRSPEMTDKFRCMATDYNRGMSVAQLAHSYGYSYLRSIYYGLRQAEAAGIKIKWRQTYAVEYFGRIADYERKTEDAK